MFFFNLFLTITDILVILQVKKTQTRIKTLKRITNCGSNEALEQITHHSTLLHTHTQIHTHVHIQTHTHTHTHKTGCHANIYTQHTLDTQILSSSLILKLVSTHTTEQNIN